MRNESGLRAALVKACRAEMPSYEILRHEDMYTAGHPDISITGMKVTLWVEVKDLGSERREDSKGIQKYKMRRLHEQGFAVYVKYSPDRAVVETPEGRTEQATVLYTTEGIEGRHERLAEFLHSLVQRCAILLRSKN